MKFVFAQKLGMTQVFEQGKVIPVTRVKVLSDNKVEAVIGSEKNGYSAVKFGARYTKKLKSRTLPVLSREVRVSQAVELEAGQSLLVDQFTKGDMVTIKGVTKGKGFAGVVKRHGFHGADATHGTKHVERAGGSVGSGFPQHILKGRKMPGRTGGVNQTIKNVEVVAVDSDTQEILVRGIVPGPMKSVIQIIG